MVLELAVLNIQPGMEIAFEVAYWEASQLIASIPGYIGHEIQPCDETPHRYIMLTRWQSMEPHTIGFRGSDQYQEWRRHLHHFYDYFPFVQGYEPLFIGAS